MTQFPYSWSPRPRGFGKTRQERIVIDLARVLNAHSCDAEQDTSDTVLAEYLYACLVARRASVPIAAVRP